MNSIKEGLKKEDQIQKLKKKSTEKKAFNVFIHQ